MAATRSGPKPTQRLIRFFPDQKTILSAHPPPPGGRQHHPNQQNIEAGLNRHQDMSRPGKLAPEVNR